MWWLEILDCDLHFSLYQLIAAVCVQTARLLLLVNTYIPYKNYCEGPRCPKTPKFPSFLVSRIIYQAYSTLHFIDWTHTERKTWRHLYDQRTVLRWTTHSSANKGPGLLCSARGGLGRGHREIAQLPMETVRMLTAVFVKLVLIFLKLLIFILADVFLYFFSQ